MYQVITDIFDDVFNAVREQFPTADLATHYVNQPASFPHVQLWEESNTSPRSGMNLNNDECFSNVVVHFEIFDNYLNGVGVDNVKTIMGLIDPVMRRQGYRRTYYAPVPNFDDASVYREIARYSKIQPN